MIRFRVAILSMLLAIVGGCTDSDEQLAGLNDEPQFVVSDAANNNGHAGFYWLQPVAKPPTTFPGTFDAALLSDIEIRICLLNAARTACSGGDIVTFADHTTPPLLLYANQESYGFSWRPTTLGNFRVRAYLGATLLGFFDAKVVAKSKDLKNVPAGFFGIVRNTVHTIRFRIEAGMNEAPAVVDDAFSVDEDNTLNVAASGVLANDSDADGDAISATLVSGTTNGALTLNADGSFVYTPAANFNGADEFTYVASDGSSSSDTATVTLTVNAINDAPVAVDDAYSTDEDVKLSVAAPGLLANDSDVDGNALTVVLSAGPSNGTLVLNGDGSFAYTPEAGYGGSDSFTYTANDGSTDSNVATVTITVTGVNDAPSAVNDSYSVDEDNVLHITGPGLLANDTDPDGNTLVVVSNQEALHGTVFTFADGAFYYTPQANYHGTDQFTYTVWDGALGSTPATVTITVNPVNDAPTAADDAYSTDEDTPLSVAAAGVLGNDSDVEGDGITAILASGPAQGSLTLNTDGSMVYTPSANYNGSDSFTYKANDGTADSNLATVTITINPVADAPAAVDDAYQVDEDGSLNVTGSGVLGNDLNPEGGSFTASIVTPVAHGTLIFASTGVFTYTPNANYNGSDSFTYRANNGSGESNEATVTITVNSVNDAPTVAGISYPSQEDNSIEVGAPGVLVNAQDVDGDALTAVLVSGVSHGALALYGNGSFEYDPALNYAGVDSFTFKVSDGQTYSTVATVTFSLAPVNDPPSAAANAYDALGNVLITVPAPGVLGNDTDPEGDALSAVAGARTSSNSGSVTIYADGSFTYLSPAGMTGSDSFTYQVTDGTLTASATVTITVNGRHWFVDDDAPPGGDGRQTSMFQSLASLSGVGGAGDPDQAGDIILVNAGSYTSGIILESNQQLIGQGIPADLTATVNGQPVMLLTAGTAPTISNAYSFGNAVTLASGNTLRGLVVGNAAGVAITGSGVGNLTIANSSINNASGRAIDLTTSGTLSVAFSSIAATGGTGNGINLVNQTGTFTSGTTTITNPNGTGIHVQGSGGFDFGATTVNKSTSNGTGVHLQSNSGTTSFGSLSITTSAGAGLYTSSAGTVSIPSGSTIAATGGAAIDASNSTFSTSGFTSVSSTGSTGRGVSLTNVAGALDLGGGSISTAAAEDFYVSGGMHGISYAGSITNTANRSVSISGRTSGTITLSGPITDTGTGILVQNNTGGTVQFTGATKVLSTGANAAVTLTSNTGAMVTFSDSLKINTTSGTGFSATGGGTVVIAGANNSIASTAGTALNVQNTTIGSGKLTFRSISANAGTNGIVLNNTGSSGGLTVLGSGGACTSAATCTGGAISNATGDGILLSNVSGVSLAYMYIGNSAGSGLQGSQVAGFTLDHGYLSGNGGSTIRKSGLRFADTASVAGIPGLTGTASITNSTITGSADDNVLVRNYGGSLTFTATSSTFSHNSDATGNDGLLFDLSGSATANVSVTGNTFTAHRGDHFQYAAANSSGGTVTFKNNVLTGGHPFGLGGGITLGASTGMMYGGYTGTIIYDVDGNTINGAITGGAVTVGLGASASTGLLKGWIRNNVIGTSGVALSCSAQGSGIAIGTSGAGTHTTSITNNTLKRCSDRGIYVSAIDGRDGVLNMTVTGNSITEFLDTNDTNQTPHEAFYMNAGATSNNINGGVDNLKVCLDLGGAGGLSNTLTGGAWKYNGADIRLRQRFQTRIEMPGYSGTAFDVAAVASYLQGRNSATATASFVDDVNATTEGYFNTSGGGACPTP